MDLNKLNDLTIENEDNTRCRRATKKIIIIIIKEINKQIIKISDMFENHTCFNLFLSLIFLLQEFFYIQR